MSDIGLSYRFPPYGHMIKEWEDLRTPQRQPDNWSSSTTYAAWLDKMSDLLGTILWPRFDPATRSWTGSATAFMELLTDLDFDLLVPLRKRITDPLTGLASIRTQYDMFQLEDEDNATSLNGQAIILRGVQHALRLTQEAFLKPQQINELSRAFFDSVSRNGGRVDLDLKANMQRPRAYQMASIMGKTGFTHQRAKSALTPAMISGHCFENLIGGAGAYGWATANAVPQPALDALAAFTVDTGDRRVYAGVHYPSDNISSWLTGLLICPEVGIAEDQTQWLWGIITTRSDVYGAIDAAASGPAPDSPYRRSMDLLKAIGAREIKTVDAALAAAGRAP